MLRPFDCAKRPFCESLPARSFVREFDPLAGTGVNDRMITHHITATQGMHSDLRAGPLTDHPGTSVADVPLIAQASNLREDLGKTFGRSAWSVFFLAVMHFNNLQVEIRAKNLRGLACKPEEGIDSDAEVGSEDDGNFPR